MLEGRQRDRFWVQAAHREPIENGRWTTAQLQVFDGETQVGTYDRTFPPYAEQTFCPFEWNGQWFALYSPEYTATRVLSLPDCRDIGGEAPAAHGFCPVEFLIPRYREVTQRHRSTGRVSKGWWFHEPGPDSNPDYEVTVGPWVTVPTAFVKGCVWGEDQSWKLQCIDLALASQGRIERTERFGFVELPKSASLSASLSFDRHPPDWDLRMTLIRQERRDVATGALVDPYDE
jgi:hypothetical protein